MATLFSSLEHEHSPSQPGPPIHHPHLFRVMLVKPKCGGVEAFETRFSGTTDAAKVADEFEGLCREGCRRGCRRDGSVTEKVRGYAVKVAGEGDRRSPSCCSERRSPSCCSERRSDLPCLLSGTKTREREPERRVFCFF
ncbi:gliding motility protein GldN [Sesbania bispinosa]|nr:gliding motility protein GldN [Sesbania bispinosa]